MTASDITRLASTVAFIQVSIDLLGYYLVYRKDYYQSALDNLTRATTKLTKATKELEAVKGGDVKKTERLSKAHNRAEQDVAKGQARVAKHHLGFRLLTALFSIMLVKIFGAEYKGHVVAILPFEPFALLKRITARGLEFSSSSSSSEELFTPLSPKVSSIDQACSFLFIYLLINMSVKFYLSKAFGVSAPQGTDSFTGMLDSPLGKLAMKVAGIDPNQYKQE